MDKDLLQKYFFITFLLVVSALVFFIFQPFFNVLVLATIFGVVLTPLHRKISKIIGGRDSISSIIVIILFIIVIVVPFILLALQVLSESHNLYTQLSTHSSADYTQKITDIIEKPIQRFYPAFSIDIGSIFSLGTDWLTAHLSAILSSVISITTKIILIIISLFFFLKDGARFKQILIDLSPLNDKYDEQIFDKMRNAITGTVRGVIFVAIIQGFLAGLGLWIFHVPNPTLWGSISAVASLIPGLGTFGVFIPAVLYMYATGNPQFAFGLILWAGLIIAVLDNFLGPYIYSRGVQIHQLLMLFAVLGSILFFGPIGFIFGPIIISLFFTLIDIYQSIILKKTSL